jgi:Tfp pilus assembly protein PilP
MKKKFCLFSLLIFFHDALFAIEKEVKSSAAFLISPSEIIDYKTLRDPFKRPEITYSHLNEKELTPLEKFPANQCKIQAIIFGFKNPRVILVDPEGGVYTAGIGTKIGFNQGVIKEIFRNKIVISEVVFDIIGNKKRVKTELALESENQPPKEKKSESFSIPSFSFLKNSQPTITSPLKTKETLAPAIPAEKGVKK